MSDRARAESLRELEDALRALLGSFEHQTERELDYEGAWTAVQASFLRWRTLRGAVAEVPEVEREREAECRRLYAALRSVAARTREGVGAELDSLRQVRTKLRAAAERRPAAPSRALDLHG